MILDIVQVGEPVLRRRSLPLSRDEIVSPAIVELIENMRETMHAAPGVGLAAPQVGVPLQVAVIEDRAEYMEKLSADQIAERGRRPVPFHALINPVCTIVEPERVECLNEKGDPVTIAADGWYARILQHEIDHLNGIVYIDRMRLRSFCGAANYERLWKNRSVADFLREIPYET